MLVSSIEERFSRGGGEHAKRAPSLPRSDWFLSAITCAHRSRRYSTRVSSTGREVPLALIYHKTQMCPQRSPSTIHYNTHTRTMDASTSVMCIFNCLLLVSHTPYASIIPFQDAFSYAPSNCIPETYDEGCSHLPDSFFNGIGLHPMPMRWKGGESSNA